MTILIQNCTQQEINAALIRLQKTFKNEQAALEGKVGSIITNTINEKYDDSSLRNLIQNVKAELENKVSTFDERIATNTTNIGRLESSLANIDVSYNETTNTLTFQNRFGYDTYFHLKDTTYTFTLDTSTNSLDITNDLDPTDTTHIPLGYRYGFTWNNGTLTITETYDGTTSTIATYNLDNRYYTEDEIDGLLADIVARITDIEDLIPPQATSSNQLADKDFVNSSIETATATFRGTFSSVADLEAYAGPKDNNDYAFVKILDLTSGIYEYDRYKYNGTEWVFEYTINSSGFTAAQLAALNSGITCSLVAKITDVYNSTIQINQNGTCCGSFTLNQSSDKTLSLTDKLVQQVQLGSGSATADRNLFMQGNGTASNACTCIYVSCACPLTYNHKTGIIKSMNTDNWGAVYSSNTYNTGYFLLAQLVGSSATGNHDVTLYGTTFKNAANIDYPTTFRISVRGRCDTINATSFKVDNEYNDVFATYEIDTTNHKFTIRLYGCISCYYTKYKRLYWFARNC